MDVRGLLLRDLWLVLAARRLRHRQLTGIDPQRDREDWDRLMRYANHAG